MGNSWAHVARTVRTDWGCFCWCAPFLAQRHPKLRPVLQPRLAGIMLNKHCRWVCVRACACVCKRMGACVHVCQCARVCACTCTFSCKARADARLALLWKCSMILPVPASAPPALLAALAACPLHLCSSPLLPSLSCLSRVKLAASLFCSRPACGLRLSHAPQGQGAGPADCTAGDAGAGQLLLRGVHGDRAGHVSAADVEEEERGGGS